MAQIALAIINKNDTPKTIVIVDSSGNEISSGGAIPVSGTVTATNPSVSPTGAAVPASATYIGGLNAGNLVGLAVDSSGRLTLQPNQVVEIGDGTTPTQKLAVDASGRLTLVPNQTVQLVDSAGTNKAAVDASGRQVFTAVSGAALQADQTNTRLAASLYYQVATAGDTALTGTASGINVRQIGASPNQAGSSTIPVTLGNPNNISGNTSGDVSATGTNTTVTATLSAIAAKTWYLTGFTITALLSTALGSADITITGLQNTLTMEMVTDDTTLGAQPTIISVFFPVPRPASAVNTSVSVAVAALGANTGKVAVTIHGQNFA